MITLKRILKFGWQNFFRDGGISVATVFILIITIFLVSSLFLFQKTSQFLISQLQEKVDISVYFKEDALEDDILKIKKELSTIPEVKSVKYVSKEEAIQVFTKRHKDNPVLMESLAEVGRNPFLASLNIKAWQADQYQTVADYLKNPRFENLIEKVDYYQRKPLIERIFSLTAAANKTGILLSLILVIVAILVTFNTIRLAILNQREEIKIQRLVGASNWFIRGPFLVQGTISGILAGLFSLLIFSLVCWLLSPKIEFFFPDLKLFSFFTENFWTIFFLQFLTGISLGVISSLIAIRRYLKI